MDSSLLSLARAGREEAFAELTRPYRRELHVHCYRMLGSVADADDLLQETMVAAWQGLAGFKGQASLRAWLYRIATNRCLNAIRDTKRRPPPVPVAPFDPPPPSRRTEITWLQPYPDAWLEDLSPGPGARIETQETIRLAFVAALQCLPPRQTAAVVLCDVLGFAVAEAAAILEVTPTAVKGLRQRARATLAAAGSGVDAAGATDNDDLAGRFADAYAADDVDGVVGLLTDDAWLRMPPAPHEYHGRAAIAAFLRASLSGRAGRRLTLVPTRANRQPAFVCHFRRPDGRGADPSGLVVLDIAGDRIAAVTRWLDPGLPAIFSR